MAGSKIAHVRMGMRWLQRDELNRNVGYILRRRCRGYQATIAISNLNHAQSVLDSFDSHVIDSFTFEHASQLPPASATSRSLQ